VGGVLLSSPHVVPETRQDLFQGLEENAITREYRTSAGKCRRAPQITIATLSITNCVFLRQDVQQKPAQEFIE
jgi:hypothetical protein